MRLTRMLVAALAVALVAAGGASAKNHRVPPGGTGAPTPLEALWRLDEPSGTTAYDATGRGHDGTYLGSPTLGVAGAPANANDDAVFFDGSQGVQVPYSPALNPQSYTVQAWVKPTALPPSPDYGVNAKSIACSRSADGVRGWMLYLDDYVGHAQFAFVVGAGSSRRYVYDDSGQAVQRGLWYHVAATYDGTDLQLYVNGVEVTSAQLNDGGGNDVQPNTDQPLQIGTCGNAGGGGGFEGAIDDVAVSSGALGGDAIAADAANGIPVPDGGWPGTCSGRCLQSAGGDVPVIVLPGTLGTYIENSSDLLWVQAFRLYSQAADSALDGLQLAPNGTDPCFLCDPATVAVDKGYEGMIRKIVPCDIPIPVICNTQHHYDVLMDALQKAGYVYHNHKDETPDQTLFALGYDWRLSSEQNALALRTKIDHVLKLTGAKQVDLLAHSQGGLVVNAYLHTYQDNSDVRRVVTLGTPYLGTPKFLGILQYKEPCEIAAGDACILNRNEAAKLVHNFPGALQLLPSKKYWDVAASPLVERVQPLSGPSTREVESYAGMLSRLAAGKQNMALINQAGSLHDFWDTFPAPAAEVLRIAGTKEATIGTIEEYAWNGCNLIPDGYSTIWDCGWHTQIKNHYTSGDGTVVAQSAQLRNCRTGVNLAPGDLSITRPHVSHEGLVHDQTTIDDAVQFLRKGTVRDPACTGVFLRRLAATGGDGLDATELHTTGPLVGAISDGTDSTGTIDATQDVSVTGIPGSTFDPSDDSASYVVTNDAQLTGTFTATADGAVSLSVDDYEDDSLVGTAVMPQTRVPKGAVLTLGYAQPLDLSLLQAKIDDNGDGSVDRVVPFLAPVSGDAANDDTPPTSTVTVTHFVGPFGKKLARVTVTAADEGGSGVARIEYQTSRGDSGVYTGPLVLPAQGDISVTATDGAGNVQTQPSFGVLDDRPGASFLVDDFKAPNSVRVGVLDYRGDEDWFGVQAPGGKLTIGLAAPFDGDLEVYDADGKLVGSSSQPGLRPEKVRLDVRAGRYTVRVFSKAGQLSLVPYALAVVRGDD